MEEDDEEQNKYRVSISYEEKKRNSWDTLIETHLKYFVNKFQQFWKEKTMGLSKRWKKKNTFSNYKHHRNILQTSSTNFGKREYNKACREMEEDDEEQNKYRVSISYEEKERNLHGFSRDGRI